MSRPRFVALDGLRGIAALAVVVLHAGTARGRIDLAPHAYLAVDFFFVLSGFVLAHAYGSRLGRNGLRWGEFTQIRLLRLMPLAVLGVALGVSFAIADPAARNGILTVRDVGIAAVFAFALIPNPFGTLSYPLNPPLWSVSMEIAVNIGWGILADKLKARRRIALLVGGAALWTIFETAFAGKPSDASRVVYGFFAGVLLYEMPTANCRWRHAAACIAIASALLLFLPFPTTRWSLSASRLVMFPLVVWLCAAIQLRGWVRRAAELSGEISYPLYALHAPIVVLTVRHGAPVGLAIVASLVVAMGAARLYDAPVRSALARRVHARRRSALGPRPYATTRVIRPATNQTTPAVAAPTYPSRV